MEDIVTNVRNVRARIAAAAERVGRPAEEVQLVAVSKTKPVADIVEAIHAGVDDFGENRAQELQEKVEELRDVSLRWHFIGHLQTNKVKYLLGHCHLIQSLDRMSLAKTIHTRARRQGIVQPCLVQVNIAGEDSKFGLPPASVGAFLDQVAPLDGLQVKGLMMIAPLVDDPEEVRPFFRQLRQLAEELRPNAPSQVSLQHLSMGMTNDFEVAVEEGATIVRVGRAIFGERQ